MEGLLDVETALNNAILQCTSITYFEEIVPKSIGNSIFSL
jgi:hypothetical protein